MSPDKNKKKTDSGTWSQKGWEPPSEPLIWSLDRRTISTTGFFAVVKES